MWIRLDLPVYGHHRNRERQSFYLTRDKGWVLGFGNADSFSQNEVKTFQELHDGSLQIDIKAEETISEQLNRTQSE